VRPDHRRDCQRFPNTSADAGATYRARKAKIREARIPIKYRRRPTPARLDAVLAWIYLVQRRLRVVRRALTRADLSSEAIRLDGCWSNCARPEALGCWR